MWGCCHTIVVDCALNVAGTAIRVRVKTVFRPFALRGDDVFLWTDEGVDDAGLRVTCLRSIIPQQSWRTGLYVWGRCNAIGVQCALDVPGAAARVRVKAIFWPFAMCVDDVLFRADEGVDTDWDLEAGRASSRK